MTPSRVESAGTETMHGQQSNEPGSPCHAKGPDFQWEALQNSCDRF